MNLNSHHEASVCISCIALSKGLTLCVFAKVLSLVFMSPEDLLKVLFGLNRLIFVNYLVFLQVFFFFLLIFVKIFIYF